MESEDKIYGRKRVKKHRPVITPKETDETATGDAVSSPEKDKASSTETHPVGKIARSSDRVEERKRQPEPMPGGDAAARRKRSKSQPRRDHRRDQTFPRTKEARPKRKSYDKHRVRVSIVMPAYDEQDNVKPLLEQFDEVIKRSGKDWEVVFVNDGSTDRTAEIVSAKARSFSTSPKLTT